MIGLIYFEVDKDNKYNRNNFTIELSIYLNFTASIKISGEVFRI